METSLLQRVPLFKSLEYGELETVASFTRTHFWPNQRVIFREGEASDSLYIILKGKVSIFVVDDNRREVTLNYLNQGDYFGEVSLFSDCKRSASVKTASDCMFAVLPKEAFLDFATTRPELTMSIIKEANLRLRSLGHYAKWKAKESNLQSDARP